MSGAAPTASAESPPQTTPYTALVTGAGRNVGRAIALHLAQPGRLLLLHGHRSSNALEAVAEQARAQGAEVRLCLADLASTTARDHLVAQVVEQAKHLNLLVNNAAVYPEQTLQDIAPEQFDQVLALNCTAVFHLTQALTPLLRSGQPSCVINLGDSGADRVQGRPLATPYHIAKLGVTVLTRSFAKALAADGITVNQINPGFLETSVGEPGSPLPMGRAGSFADILGALDYLTSSEARYVSGASLTVSGGWNV